MESISNGVEDYLIDGLSFKLPPGSSYITDRRKSTFWASGSNIYKSEGGTRVVRFLLNGEDGTWLDPSSIRIQFDLRNNEATAKRVRPLRGPHLFSDELEFWSMVWLQKTFKIITELMK